MTDDGISPERFRQAREYATDAGEKLDVTEIEHAIEDDTAPRTVQSAKAFGFVSELRYPLEGDDA